jgi:DNA-binding transcriptional LysR family regulator
MDDPSQLAMFLLLLKLSDEAHQVVAGSEIPKGTLTIGAPESLCVYRLPPVLRCYRDQYPPGHANLHGDGAENVDRRLDSGSRQLRLNEPKQKEDDNGFIVLFLLCGADIAMPEPARVRDRGST